MSEEQSVVKKESNGQKFKRKNGFSLSRKKAMKKAGTESLEEYRQIVKQRKKLAKIEKREKHSLKKAARGSKVKSKK